MYVSNFLGNKSLNPTYECENKISPDINPNAKCGKMVRHLAIFWWSQKGMTIEYRSYVIGHKFINPIIEFGVKYPRY